MIVLIHNRPGKGRLCYNLSMSSFLRNSILSGFVVISFFVFNATFVDAQELPPTNLTATFDGACSVTLTWTPNNLDRYVGIQAERYASNYSLCNFSSPYTLATTALPIGVSSYTHTGIAPNSRYCYRVQTKRQSGSICSNDPLAPNYCTSWSQLGPNGELASTTTPIIPAPSVATFTLAIARDGGSRVELYWATTTPTRFSDPGNAYYNIYRDNVLIATTSAYAGPVPVGIYQDTTAIPGNVHTYQIQSAQSAPGCMLSSVVTSARSIAITVPVMPGNFAASYTPTSTEGVVGDVDLVWTDGSGPINQLISIFRREASEASPTIRANLPLGIMAFKDDPLTLRLDSTYEYQLRSCSRVTTAPYLAFGCSDTTDPIPVSVANGAAAVQARLYYVDSFAETGNLLLSWKNAVIDSNYAVRRSTNGGPWVLVGGSGGTDSDPETVFLYRETDVPLGDFYKYEVSVDEGSGVLTNPVESGTVNLRVEKILYGYAYSSVGPGYTPSGSPAPLINFKSTREVSGLFDSLVPTTKAAFAPIQPRIPAIPIVPIPQSHGGAGWINFNSDYPSPGSPSNKYSVQVDEDGVLSGVAWAGISDPTTGDQFNYGWLSFNRDDLRGCLGQSELIACAARMDKTTGKMSGWARFIGFKNLTGADQWYDGWVSLASFGGNPYPYGSAFDSSLGKIIGTAWGSFVNPLFNRNPNGIGWMAMGRDECRSAGGSTNCDIFVSERTNRPIVRNVNVRANGIFTPKLANPDDPTSEIIGRWGGDPFCASSTEYQVSWNYNGPESFPNWVEIEFTPVSGSGKTVFLSTSTVGTVSPFPFAGVGGFPVGESVGTLDYGTDYVARVRAGNFFSPPNEDSMDWSDWASSGVFTTPTHYYPFVDFSTQYAGQDLALRHLYDVDGSVSLDRSVGSPAPFPQSGWGWSWEFGDAVAGLGDPDTASGNPARTRFLTSSTYPIKLTVDDGGGGVCNYTQLNVNPDIGDSGQPRRRIWVEP